MPVAAALLRVQPADFYKQLALRLRVGEEVPFEEVIAHLESVSQDAQSALRTTFMTRSRVN